jgi:hypothetical protein
MSHTMTTTKLEAALTYASWGWHVLPVMVNEKIPATAHGVHDATIDPEQIKAWWSQNPDYNIGIAAGQISNIAVFDIDPRNGGDLSWEVWLAEYGAAPDGAYQLTAGGGQHYIGVYRDSIKSCKLRDGIDLLSNGRYFLASPSTIDGRQYDWEASSDPFEGVAPFQIPDPWLAALSVRKVIATAQSSLIEGNRNAGLTAIAGSLRRLGMTEPEILAALTATNENRCSTPLPASEIRQISRSVSRYEPEFDVARDTALGTEAAENLLKKTKQYVHPLAQFVKYDLKHPKPQEYILDGIIGMGLLLFAGAAGGGKTTNGMTLFTRVAHLCRHDDPLKPLLRRKVIYITEDSQQAINILRSMRISGDLGDCSDEEMHEYFKIVDAKRLPVAEIIKVASVYLEMLTPNTSPVTGEVVMARPYPVFDTSNATINIENESDNSAVGQALAALKQHFLGLSMCVIGHIAKALKRAEVADFSARGAGAWEADANQVCYLIKEEDGSRWLEIKEAKHRFVARVDGIKFETIVNVVDAFDMLGNKVEEVLVHGQPMLIEAGGKKALKDKQAQQKKNADESAKALLKKQSQDMIIAELESLEPSDYRTSNQLCEMLKMSKGDKIAFIKNMVQEKMIQQIELPYPEIIIKKASSHRTIYVKANTT